MLFVFQGASSLTLDGKGRLSIPTRHRDVLLANARGQLTITRHPHGCLMMFERPEWELFRQRIAQLPMSAQWWKRILLGNAMDVEMDKQGRAVLPEYLRSFAGLKKSVIVAGLYNRLEIWDETKWDEFKTKTEKESGEIAERMAELGV